MSDPNNNSSQVFGYNRQSKPFRQPQLVSNPVPKSQESFLKQFGSFLAGPAIIQALNKTILAPIDRYQLLCQAQQVVDVSNRFRYKSSFDYIRRIPREYGYKGFYRGNLAHVLYSIPRAIVQFSILDAVNSAICPLIVDKDTTELEYGTRKFCAAFVSGFLTLCVAYPLDLARARLALSFQKTPETILGVLTSAYKQDGILGLYRGFLMANFANIPYYMTLFSAFQLFKSHSLSEYDGTESFKYMAPATVAGLLSTLVTYPFDTLKRRLQMNGTNGHFSFYNTEDCASKMFTNEGATSFYLGITAATVKFLSTAALQTVLLSLYFQMKKATSSF